MDRTEFIAATAILLFAAFLLGWFACWLAMRLTRTTQADMGQLDRMAQDLHEAEQARDAAVADLEGVEADLKTRLVTSESELRDAQDSLRESRAEVEELRAYIERKLSRIQQGGAPRP